LDAAIEKDLKGHHPLKLRFCFPIARQRIYELFNFDIEGSTLSSLLLIL